MPRTREIVIAPPLGGYVSATAFQQQDPYTHPGSLNFWPSDVKDGARRRPSVRPRLTDNLGDVGNGSTAVRAIAQLNTAGSFYERHLLCISNGVLFYFDSGSFQSIGGSFTTTRHIDTAPYLNKLYIADGTNWSVWTAGGSLDSNPTATAGTKPTSVTLVTAWNDRLVWSGNSTTPHAWWMSRQGDPLDYEYGLADDDVTQAVEGTSVEGGLIGEKITSLIPHNRNCLLFGATDSILVLRGDPMQGGRIELLSETVGPLSQTAWCHTSAHELVTLTHDGIYVMPPGCGSPPKKFSKQRIPDSLMGVDTATYEIFLAYDARYEGVNIYLTGSSSREAWFLDWETGGFWKMELTTTEQPRSIMRFDPLSSSTETSLLIGGAGGNIRQFDSAGTGTLTANMYFGPIKLSSSPMSKGMIQRAAATFGDSTTDTTGTLAIYCAESGEAAYNAAVADTASYKYSATIAQWQNNRILYPRVGGHAAVLKLSLGTGTAYQSIEDITLTVRDAGVGR